MISKEFWLTGIAGPPPAGVDLVHVDGERVGADRRHADIDIGARDHRENHVDVVVMDQVRVAVGRSEGVLRGLRQIGNRLHPVVRVVDVVGDAVDHVDEEVVGVGELGGDRVVAAVVERERRRR